MKEDKEQELAKRLGDSLGGDGAATGDAEIEAELDTAYALRGALGGGPELKPEFDATLRARLVREAGKRKPKSSVSPLRRKWVQYAVAAVLVIVIAPTVMMIKDRADDPVKLEKVQKYDKMYVPFSEKMKEQSYGSRLEPFSDDYRRRVREMSRSAARKRAASYYDNYRRERRLGP